MNRTNQSTQQKAVPVDLTAELLQAVISATDERKRAALRVLRGEAELCTQPQPTERFITLKEAAQQLNVSACSLWRWGVPGHKLGGRPKFRMSEILAYLESDAFQERAESLRRADRLRRKQKGATP